MDTQKDFLKEKNQWEPDPSTCKQCFLWGMVKGQIKQPCYRCSLFEYLVIFKEPTTIEDEREA